VTSVDRLVLGTVQFGLPYGVSHAGGAVAADEVARILDLAGEAGVRTLDTAAAYGGSERVLGSLDASRHFDIITKTIPVTAAEVDDAAIATIEAGVHASLEQLRCARVAGLLVHNVQNLAGSGGARLWSCLERFHTDGQVAQLGVSVYSAEEAEAAADRFPIEFVQLPLNVFDQRPVASGGLERLAARGIRIYVRSVFLQGLLLMDPEALPADLAGAAPFLRRWREACATEGASPLAAALSFALSQPAVAGLVVGVHSREHLAECLDVLGHPVSLAWPALSCADPRVTDPRTWSNSWKQPERRP
jgi:aryl-alcohol dehydrogenase-like predicted oxidoreductase